MPTLDFKGKQHIYAHHLTGPYRPLVLDDTRSCNPSGIDDNLIIHGDNLHALKALLPRYAGRVKCIYIDPPYNTGNEGWVYSDRVNSRLMREWLEKNTPVDNEDLERHDKWLCMMWPRLHLLRELLAEDGAILVSIDDNEQHHLRMLMDEIFGPENFVSSVTWQKKVSPSNDAKHFSYDHEYIAVYAKDKEIWRPNRLPMSEKQKGYYRNPITILEATGIHPRILATNHGGNAQTSITRSPIPIPVNKSIQRRLRCGHIVEMFASNIRTKT